MKKKRAKKYHRKIVCNPLGIRSDHLAEIPLLAAVGNLGTDKLTIDNISFIGSFVLLMERLYAPISATEPAADALNAIFERYNSTGKIGASGDELRAIRESIPTLLEFYRAQSNYNIVKAVTEMTRKMSR